MSHTQTNLTKQEQDELYHFLVLERLMRLAKLNAHQNQTV